MGLSVNEYTYAGDDTFNLNFALGFISRLDVTAYTYDPIGDPDAEVQLPLTFDWNTDTQIELTPGQGLVNGDPVVVRRTVSKTTLPVDITQLGEATRENLEIMFLYTVMMAQEVIDGRTAEAGAFESATETALQVIFDYDYLTAYETARDA